MENPKSKFFRNVYVGNLPSWIATFNSLLPLFSQFGLITRCRLFNRGTRSASYALVQYLDARNAQKARQYLNGLIVDKHTLKVDWAKKNLTFNDQSVRGLQKRNVYLSPLPISFTSRDLVDLCAPFGKIIGVKLFNNYGLVRFKTESQATEAIAHLNGCIPFSGQDKIQAKIAREHPIQIFDYQMDESDFREHLNVSKRMGFPWRSIVSHRHITAPLHIVQNCRCLPCTSSGWYRSKLFLS